MKSKDLQGKTVVSIADGSTLGQIDDVLVDTDDLRVAALHLKGHGEDALIPFEQVKSATGDVVTVPSSGAARRPRAGNETERLASLGEMSRLKVIDEEGTFLGVVQSVDVDPHNGAIVELQTQKATAMGLGRAQHTIAASEVTSVGDAMVVVQAPEPLTTDAPDPFYLTKGAG